MKIIINRRAKNPKAISLEDFADAHGLTMEVNERDESFTGKDRFYASFQDCETKTRSSDNYTVATYGNGATVKEAIAEYKNAIRGLILIKDACSRARREIVVPELE
jgi:hypothetical protein